MERAEFLSSKGVDIQKSLELFGDIETYNDTLGEFLVSITDKLNKLSVYKESKDLAILTNMLTQIWSGYSIKEYKDLKGLKKENLRDNMTNMELVLNMLAETSSTEISKSNNENGFEGAEKAVLKGGNIAKMAKEQLEKETRKKIISNKNVKEIKILNGN